MTHIITLIIELIGTVAFSFSGAMVAIEKKMDIFGVMILGMTTAVGGGIIRDVIIGNTPPQAFVDPVYLLVAIGVAIAAFLPVVRRVLTKRKIVFDLTLLVMDSLGLSIFTVAGIDVAINACPQRSVFLLVFVGVLTGVGGGVLRDMMAGNTPFIFVKFFYASASLLGAALTVALWDLTGRWIAMASGAMLIMVLRMLAAHYRWKLPRAKTEDETENKQKPTGITVL